MMEYKVGDKVRIKTWGKMRKEYGLNEIAEPRCNELTAFTTVMENKLPSDRIVEINEAHEKYYYEEGIKVMTDAYYSMKKIKYNWTDEMIEGLASKTKLDPITSRFEILDI